MKYLKKTIASVLLFLMMFTVACLVIFCYKDSVPDTLVTAVYAALGGELLIGGIIKISEMSQETQKQKADARKRKEDMKK